MKPAVKRVMVIYGTRPEAVKMAPLIKAITASPSLEPIVVSTGQHQEMLDQVNTWFGIQPRIDLEAFTSGGSLNELSARIIHRLDPVLESEQPDAVIVQGDTTTVAMSAIASFYRRIPVVHLEAGLRSGNISSPFPEEANRKIASQLAHLHLAPTAVSRQNLLREGVANEAIVVVGNTVIDALQWTASQPVSFTHQQLQAAVDGDRPILLLTTHRRENWGEPMRQIGHAMAEIAHRYPEFLIVFPAHANPLVREQVVPAIEGLENVLVCDPLSYPEFVHLQKKAHLILTDSGGVQEEAPSLGKPVLVLRDNTERPEAVQAGTVRLIGTNTDHIVTQTAQLIDDPSKYDAMSRAVNPYGDGHAGARGAAAIAHLLGVGNRLPEFTPTQLNP